MLEQIKNTIKLTTDIYLEKHFPRIPEDKKQIAINAYEKDIERLANFVYNSWFLNENFLFTEDFIKWFHKNLYPENFFQKKKDEKWREFIWMIPGEYKKIKIISNDRKNARDLPNWKPNEEIYTLPENTEIEMGKLLSNFSKIENTENKKDFILFFINDLLYIHPFWDWNWRLIKILCDLLCLKYNINTFWLMKIWEKNKLELNKSMYLSHNQRNLKYIYDFIEKYS